MMEAATIFLVCVSAMNCEIGKTRVVSLALSSSPYWCVIEAEHAVSAAWPGYAIEKVACGGDIHEGKH
jgi:hypothetical protein